MAPAKPQAAGSGRNPSAPRIPVYRGGLANKVFVFNHLRDDAARARLEHLRAAEWRRKASRGNQHAAALSAGIWALTDAMERWMAVVQERGQLLFCWHGTQFIPYTEQLEGGAA